MLFRNPLPREYHSKSVSLGSRFGYRTLNGKRSFHNAVDLKSRGMKVPCYAAESGKVISVATNGRVDKNPSYSTPANYVIIDHGNGYRTGYWHLSWVAVKVGDRVKKGDRIGNTGNTGYSFGVHLHFIVWKNGNYVNPEPLIDWDFSEGNTSNLSVNKNTMSTNTVTVQSGWGLSHVAQAAGLPVNQQTYEQIYRLNVGHRGSTDWRSLNSRMGAGDVLVVRANSNTTTTPKAIDNSAEVKKLKSELAKLEEEKAKSETEAKQKFEQLVEKNAELEAVKQAEIAKEKAEKEELRNELESQLNEVNAELSELEASSVKLPEHGEIADLATGLIVSEFKESGLKEKYHNWVDSTFKSNYVRSFLKYDWFYVVVIAIGAFTTLSANYTGDNEAIVGVISALTAIGSQIMKYILTNYDKNKDGIIDLTDTSIGELSETIADNS